MDFDADLESLKKFLESHGLRDEFDIEDLPGVGNNRAYRLRGKKNDLFLKEYFKDPEDKRDRLGTEFRFSMFAWKKEIYDVAKPIAVEETKGWGVYEYLHGTPLAVADIGPTEIKAASKFFRSLNQHRDSAEAKALKPASEAFFSIREQMNLVGRRIASLKRMEPVTPVHQEARKFVESELAPAWETVVAFIDKESSAANIEVTSELAPSNRCLSPSDFGFHNALRDKDNRLRFFDFEYAGWDDPAKTVNDFYFQPRIPVRPALMPPFVDDVLALFKEKDFHRFKIGVMRPLFGLKWSCIMLNHFSPVGSRRRQFSTGAENWEARLKEQIKKSRAQLQRVFPLNMDLSVWK